MRGRAAALAATGTPGRLFEDVRPSVAQVAVAPAVEGAAVLRAVSLAAEEKQCIGPAGTGWGAGEGSLSAAEDTFGDQATAAAAAAECDTWDSNRVGCANEASNGAEQQQQGEGEGAASFANSSDSTAGGSQIIQGEYGGEDKGEGHLLGGEEGVGAGLEQEYGEGGRIVYGLSYGLEETAATGWDEPGVPPRTQSIGDLEAPGEGPVGSLAASGSHSSSFQLTESSQGAEPAVAALEDGVVGEQEEEDCNVQHAREQQWQGEEGEQEQLAVQAGVHAADLQQGYYREQQQVEAWAVEGSCGYQKGLEQSQEVHQGEQQDHQQQLQWEEQEEEEQQEELQQQQEAAAEELKLKQPKDLGWLQGQNEMSEKQHVVQLLGDDEQDFLQLQQEQPQQLQQPQQHTQQQQLQQPTKGKVKMIAANLEGRLSLSAKPPPIGHSLAKRSASSTDSTSMVSPRTYARPLMCPQPMETQQSQSRRSSISTAGTLHSPGVCAPEKAAAGPAVENVDVER